MLLVIAIWLKKTGKKFGFVIGPMIFMNVMTLWGLVTLLVQSKLSPVGIIAAALLLLALILMVEACKTIRNIIAA